MPQIRLTMNDPAQEEVLVNSEHIVYARPTRGGGVGTTIFFASSSNHGHLVSIEVVQQLDRIEAMIGFAHQFDHPPSGPGH